MRTLPMSPGVRVFLLVWCGQLLSWLGSGLSAFGLGVWVYELTGSPTRFALTVLAVALPRILLAPLAGPLVDRMDRRRVMLLSDLGAGLVTLALALLLGAGWLAPWHVYLGVALSAACGAFQRPAYAASVALLVPRAAYARANGLISLARAGADLAAPVLAGYLLVELGLTLILLIDLATFAFAAGTLLLVRFPAPPRPAEAEPGGAALLREARDGWRYLRRRPGLFGLLLYAGAGNLFGVTTEALLTPYLLALTTADALGWIMSMGGAGLLAGGLALSLWGGPRRQINGIFGFELGVCGCSILIGLARSPWLIAPVVLGYFMLIALSDGCATALWQAKVAPAFQGRVFALREAISFAALPLGLLLGPPLAELVFEPALRPGGAWAAGLGRLVGAGPGAGIALLFIIAGLVNLLLILWAWSNPRIRRLEAEIPDEVPDEIPDPPR